MYRKFLIATGLTLMLGTITTLAASCSRQAKTSPIPSDSIAQNDVEAEPELAFPLPNIPLSLTTPQERASYFVKHYWDEFNFTDSSYLAKPQNMEVSVANFLGVAIALPLGEAKPSILLPIENSSGGMLELFLRLYKKYLYDPNSPILNEEYYIPVVESALKSPKVSYAERVRLKERYELMLRNRVGKKAEDFVYELGNGSLHRLSTRFTPHTMLVFYEPGCHTCAALLQQLQNDELFRSWSETKQLDILFIYPDGDKTTWQAGLSEFPAFIEAGINSDGSIVSKQLYDIKATPTIYLLDKHGYVLQKDARIEVIKEYLNEKK